MYKKNKIEETIKEKITGKIKYLNENFQLDIDDITDEKTENGIKNWVENIKRIYFVFRTLFKREIKMTQGKYIKENILKRHNNFKDNKKKYLDSVLKREKPRIITENI